MASFETTCPAADETQAVNSKGGFGIARTKGTKQAYFMIYVVGKLLRLVDKQVNVTSSYWSQGLLFCNVACEIGCFLIFC